MIEADALKRLRWRCRRGMRELDLILEAYLEHRAAHMDADEQQLFARFLESTDMDLYGWMTGREQPADAAFAELIASMRASSEAP